MCVCGVYVCRYWTEEEHQRFLDAIQNYGHKDVKAIASVVGTRNATQVLFFFFSSSHGHKDVQAIASFVGTRNATQIVSLNMMCVYIHRCTCVFYLHMCIESVLGTQNVLCACIYCVCVCVCVYIYTYIYII